MYNPLDELHSYERWAINALFAVFVLLILGVGLESIGVSNPLSEFLFEYYFDPIRGESTGDSGYNNYNTMKCKQEEKKWKIMPKNYVFKA